MERKKWKRTANFLLVVFLLCSQSWVIYQTSETNYFAVPLSLSEPERYNHFYFSGVVLLLCLPAWASRSLGRLKLLIFIGLTRKKTRRSIDSIDINGRARARAHSGAEKARLKLPLLSLRRRLSAIGKMRFFLRWDESFFAADTKHWNGC